MSLRSNDIVAEIRLLSDKDIPVRVVTPGKEFRVSLIQIEEHDGVPEIALHTSSPI